MSIRFLKGLVKLYPEVHDPVPLWDLNLVLSRLMGLTFEPLVTCSLLHLSVKVAFLIAITYARRVGELCAALMSGPPYTISFKDKIYQHPHSMFVVKVVSAFLSTSLFTYLQSS